jgi:hypothetical protein
MNATRPESRLSQWQAESTLEGLGLTRERVMAMTAHIPRAARAADANRGADSALYRIRKASAGRSLGTRTDCRDVLLTACRASGHSLTRISAEAGLHKSYLATLAYDGDMVGEATRIALTAALDRLASVRPTRQIFRQVAEVLADGREWASGDVAARLGLDPAAVSKGMYDLVEHGKAVRVRRGVYRAVLTGRKS